jgi:hypothetical protein
VGKGGVGLRERKGTRRTDESRLEKKEVCCWLEGIGLVVGVWPRCVSYTYL